MGIADELTSNIGKLPDSDYVKNPALEGKMEDGGERMVFEGGALREPAKGKGRYDLITPLGIERSRRWNENSRMDDDARPSMSPLEMVYEHIQEFRRGVRRTDHIAAAVNYLLDHLNRESVQVDGRETYWSGVFWYGLFNPFVYERLAKWYELGAEKYKIPRNWEKGMSYSRLLDSAKRHINRFVMGHRGEDHLIAALWNLLAYLHYEEMGLTQFDDVPKYEEANKNKLTWEYMGEPILSKEETQKFARYIANKTRQPYGCSE